ncbi:hypothetical protein G4V62_07190 [Bacillaceae bacterium SIJ1]|uniref:N-acetylglucosamine kinase n=1 Tax=Litoribacterium kuwaitense TaxID=1398745 RepID=UPI0013ED1A3F|nr:BadF/BadG/BcrA/BcrD ATPase family protein [Litoribacterium kuwaitense]NGP44750.1 hypothetical protein [Litoribacterium kuwaitense]
MTILLGIDGGGTKTTGRLVDVNSGFLAERTVGPTNPSSRLRKDVENELALLIKQLLAATRIPPSDVSACFAGVAGASRPDIQQWLTQTIDTMLGSRGVTRAGHDGVNALFSGTNGHPGIVHIAGTGSLTYGISQQGSEARAGGWGYLLGDVGSGFSLGQAAMKAVLDAHDGVGPATALREKLCQVVGVEAPGPGFIEWVYDHADVKTRLASLAPFVFEAAEEGDAVAHRILSHAGQAMGRAVGAVMTHLNMTGGASTVPVVLAGSVAKRTEWLVPAASAELHRTCGGEVSWILPEDPPVAGAVFAAHNLFYSDGKMLTHLND